MMMIDGIKLAALAAALNNGIAMCNEHTPKMTRATGQARLYAQARELFKACTARLVGPPINEADHMGNRLESIERMISVSMGTLFVPRAENLADDVTSRLFHHALNAQTLAYQILSESK